MPENIQLHLTTVHKYITNTHHMHNMICGKHLKCLLLVILPCFVFHVLYCIQCTSTMCIWYQMSPIPKGIMNHSKYVVILSNRRAIMTIPLSRVTHSTYVPNIDRIMKMCVYICMICCKFSCTNDNAQEGSIGYRYDMIQNNLLGIVWMFRYFIEPHCQAQHALTCTQCYQS